MRCMSLEPIIQSREKKLYIINTYIWNLERLYWWTYFQGSSGDADKENRLVYTVGEGEGGMNGERSVETYILTYVK